jgi:hypothetical protein
MEDGDLSLKGFFELRNPFEAQAELMTLRHRMGGADTEGRRKPE